MNKMRPDIDLTSLDRPEPKLKQPRRWKLIYGLPIIIVVVFLAVLSSSIQDLLRSKAEVSVIRPQVVSGIAARSGSVVLQAAGWIEPEPFAKSVSALTTGVIDEVLIKESDFVRKGQPVARIIDSEKRLLVDERQAQVQKAEAELELAKAEFDHAESSYAQNLELTAAFETAKAMDEAQEFEVKRNQASAKAQKAKVAIQEAELETQKYLRKEGASGPWQVELAQAKCDEERAKLEVVNAELSRSRSLKNASEAKLNKASKDLKFRFADTLRLKTTAARVKLGQARLTEARSALAQAKLQLKWCVVLSPTDGIVMGRMVMPGSLVSKRSGESTICTLYDPKELRLRVDVPQTDIAKVSMGQEVRVTTGAKKSVYQGVVIRILDEADIAKVTLQVHVKIISGDNLIKPEMLCQAKFIAAEKTKPTKPRSAITVPTRLLVGQDKVWVVDPMGKAASLRSIRVGSRNGEFTEILEGINESDKLIDRGREGLQDGQAITIVEESK